MFDYNNEMPTTYAKLVNPNAGYDSEKERAKLLKPGVFYEVERISMGQSSTSVKLKDFRIPFNSVQLGFYNKDKEEIDIYIMPEYNPYMRMRNTE